MADSQQGMVMRHLRRILEARPPDDRMDQQLLATFVAQREEAAFTALVERHGAMVLGVCRRVLNDWHDAEDAFQATFLVLARKAASIQRPDSLASWLYGVAYRVALKARVRAARRRKHERQRPPELPAQSSAQAAWQELRPLLDEELARLPDKYRAPLVLCYLEGKTRDEAAQQLGWTQGMVKGRLERGRDLLRGRLARRGLTFSAALLVTSLSPGAAPAALIAPLMRTAVKAAMSVAAGQTPAAGAVSASAARLMEGVLRAMWITKLQIVAAVMLALGLTFGGAGWLTHQALADKGDEPKPATAGGKAAAQEVAKPQKDEEAIQGTWYAVKAEFKGEPLPPEDIQMMKIVIEDDKLTVMTGEDKNDRLRLKLDPTKKPKIMTVTMQNNESTKWIYALEGKRLTLCGVEQPGAEAPTEFTSPKGSRQFLLVLGRDKPNLPPAPKEEPGQKTASGVARMRSQNNLKQIALAMHNYHDTYGSLPAAAIYSKDGKPLLSWRVAILPYVEQLGLYQQFHLDEPWDSEHNKKLLDRMPKLYAPVGGAVKDKHSTFYQVFVGKGTMFEGEKGIKLTDVTDGLSHTIMVAEAGEAVPWTKPADLNYAADKPLPKLGGMLKGVFNVAMGDGAVTAIPEKFNEKAMRLFITRNDGMPVELDDLKP